MRREIGNRGSIGGGTANPGPVGGETANPGATGGEIRNQGSIIYVGHISERRPWNG
jgi:hypothetical protein